MTAEQYRGHFFTPKYIIVNHFVCYTQLSMPIKTLTVDNF